MGIFRPATLADVRHIAPHLREADDNEAKALMGLPAAMVLEPCFNASRDAWAICDNANECGGVVGIQDIDGHPDVGVVWMVATDGLARHGFEFLLECRQHLPTIHRRHPILTNFVDERNRLHIKWLRWMGFSLLRRIERWGAESLPFIEFARLHPSCASQP